MIYCDECLELIESKERLIIVNGCHFHLDTGCWEAHTQR